MKVRRSYRSHFNLSESGEHTIAMIFADAKSTLIHLPLFVTLIRFGHAQGFTNDAEIRDFSDLGCGEDQFQCLSQQCIESQLLCDGRADCPDSSDETEYQCSRPELNCPTYAFRCDYGACIDRELRCDGKKDCSADNSDEDSCIHKQTGNDGFLKPITRRCVAPPLPINGIYQIRQISETNNFENVDPEGYFGQQLKSDSHLVYSCHPGYKIRGNADVRCSRLGKWSSKPVCIEIRCRPLGSPSTIANCTHASGLEEPCSNIIPVTPKTRAQVSCGLGYTKAIPFEFFRIDNVTCNEDGKWVPEPIKCVPVCGRLDPDQKSLTADETMTSISTFPWHASIYVKGNSSNGKKTFRCGATVIQSNLLLTAARCLYTTSSDESSDHEANPSNFLERLFVITGNIHRDYGSPLHDSQFVREHRVKNVHTDCSFRVKLPEEYSDDIALAELEEPLVFTSNLLPACLDMTGVIQQSLEAGANGRLPDSARSPTVSSSQILRPTTVASMYNDQCTILYNATRSPFNIKDNRFCNELNTEGMELCTDAQFNDGGGLFYGVNNRWYVMGFVSQNTTVHTDSNGMICNRNSQLLYTKVVKYTRWIQQVISDLERFKYPPCTRYLAPFGIVTTTPASTSTLSATVNSTNVQILSRMTGSSCSVPPHPRNGERKLHRDFCEDDMDCYVSAATELARGSQLVYSCGPGYRIQGNTDVYCGADGIWSSHPRCIEIRCPPLDSVSTIMTCSRLGKWVDCYYPVSPNTQARVSCCPGYRAAPVQDEIVKCNNNGMWEPEPSVCVPACGETLHRSGAPAGVRIAADAYDFPWRASVYVERNLATGNRKDFQCGATFIQTNLLLTAAHCVYNDRTGEPKDPKKFFILMGNIHRQYDSPFHDPHSVRKGTVKNVYVHCGYNGLKNNYVSDIALLELQESFEFFNIQLPFACLDFNDYAESLLGPDRDGTVFGFGKTVTGSPSYVLQTITLPYMSATQHGITENESITSTDKFRAGYNNGTGACLADGGSGLYSKLNGLWYVTGIASVDLYVGASGENTCGRNADMLYTNISGYMKWILGVMFHLERYKSYPPCIRNSPIADYD